MEENAEKSLATTEPTMLPFEEPTIFDQLPRYIYHLPRVVHNQRSKFESDDLFKKCSRESEVKYTGYRDRQREERQFRFSTGLREGHTELAYTAHGTNLQLVFTPCPPGYSNENCDFVKEPGKVYLRSSFIMNGVCVRWHGWMDLERLEGMGCIEFDEERAKMEDARLQDLIRRHNERVREYNNKKIFRDQVQGATDIGYPPS